ncbi:VSP [Giardia duodenalis ATCC 50581]|nr:VSP [Giardia intestinalis ATCC 50581]
MAPSEPTNKPTCTKCNTKYLKTAADGTTTCVDQDKCVTDSFPVTNAQTGNKCVSCGDTDAGIPNCAKCTLSSGVTKPTCSECNSGYKLEGETCVSTGGPNLSTGAIAGISVAAVVVVGGLVGFLCWWFVCRGKA